jgi:RNA polymerase sigma-70 factor (ECF subfamily)
MDRRTPRPFESVANRGGADIDPALVKRALAGDAAAQEELWRQVLILVVKLARIICKGAQDSDVDNVIQNSMLALIKRAKRIGHIRNWPAYLGMVITRCLIDIYREAHRRENWLSLDAHIGGDAGESPARGNLLPAPDNVLEKIAVKELRERLERFLTTLPKEQATVFRLHLKGCSYQEMAEKVGCPLGTVGTWINRVKSAILGWLEASDEQRFV